MIFHFFLLFSYFLGLPSAPYIAYSLLPLNRLSIYQYRDTYSGENHILPSSELVVAKIDNVDATLFVSSASSSADVEDGKSLCLPN